MPSLLDGVHQTVKVGAERLQAGRIQEESALAGGVGGGVGRVAAGLAQGNLLVLAEELDFALREAQLRVGDGGGHHTILTLHTMVGHRARCACHPAATKRARPCLCWLLWRCRCGTDWECGRYICCTVRTPADRAIASQAAQKKCAAPLTTPRTSNDNHHGPRCTCSPTLSASHVAAAQVCYMFADPP